MIVEQGTVVCKEVTQKKHTFSINTVESKKIFPQHFEELRASEIAPEIIDANFISLDGTMGEDTPMNLLLPQTDKYYCQNGSPRSWVARRYNHLDQGGWGVISGDELICFKPDTPRCSIKSIKFDGYSFKNQEISISPFLANAIKEAYPNQKIITIKITNTTLEPCYQNELFKLLQTKYHGVFNKVEFRLKPIKYEHAPDTPSPIFKLSLTKNIASKLISHFSPIYESDYLNSGLTFGEWLDQKNINFWQWLINHPEIPIVITEGAKKTASLLSNGYVAIGLSGVWNGQITIKDEVTDKVIKRQLKPELEILATKGREFIFCYDNDTKKETIINVNKAIAVTGQLLQYKGCNVSVMSWLYPEKGIDDVIFTHGKKALDEIFNNRKNLDYWQNSINLSLDKYNPVIVNHEKLCDEIIVNGKKELINKNLGINSNSQIIAIKSDKATGKTEFLANIAKEASHIGQPVLILTHRIQLGRALCNRFGIDYVDTWHKSETSIFGMGLCIDSLHPDSQARFNPKQWQGAIVFLDEIEQILWHVLNSSTCKNERVKILKTLRQLLQLVIETGGKIYLSDADLSSISIDYIKEISGYNKQPFVIKNTYKRENKRNLFVYGGSSPTALYQEITTQLKEGKKLMIHLSGQKPNSKWGTQVIEKALQKEINKILTNFPDKKILRIDAETVADPNHEAYGIMENLNETLPYYDLVLASPTIETGVSIDLKNHFDSVFFIGWGIQSVDSVCQTLERVRDDIPRYIWVNKQGLPSLKVGNGATNVKALLASTHAEFKANFTRLQQLGIDDISLIDENDEYLLSKELLAYAKRGVVINQGFYNYRDEIIDKLAKEGYQTIECDQLKSDVSKAIKEELTKDQEEHYSQYCEDVSNSNDLTHKEAETIKKSHKRTERENKELRKYELSQRYNTEVTPYLIGYDDDGLYSKLQLEYYLSMGKEYLPKREKAKLENLQDDNKDIFEPDANKYLISLKIWLLEKFGIFEKITANKPLCHDDLIEWHQKLSQGYIPNQINQIFGFKIDPNPIKALNQFCDRLGYTFKNDKTLTTQEKDTVTGKKIKTRYYLPENNYPEINRAEIFNYWLSLDLERDFKMETTDPNNIDINHKTIVSTKMNQPVVNSTHSGCINLETTDPNNRSENNNPLSAPAVSFSEIWKIFKAIAHCQDRFMSLAQFPLDLISESFLALEKINLPLVEKLVELGFYDFMAQF